MNNYKIQGQNWQISADVQQLNPKNWNSNNTLILHSSVIINSCHCFRGQVSGIRVKIGKNS